MSQSEHVLPHITVPAIQGAFIVRYPLISALCCTLGLLVLAASARPLIAPGPRVFEVRLALASDATDLSAQVATREAAVADSTARKGALRSTTVFELRGEANALRRIVIADTLRVQRDASSADLVPAELAAGEGARESGAGPSAIYFGVIQRVGVLREESGRGSNAVAMATRDVVVMWGNTVAQSTVFRREDSAAVIARRDPLALLARRLMLRSRVRN